MRALSITAVLLGCSEPTIVSGPPLAASEHLVVVAHQDDDLIFMQQDLDDAIVRGESLTIVYSTQGIVADGMDKIVARSVGSQTAYGHAARSDHWKCGWIEVAGLPVNHCRLEDRPVSLVYLGYPDGGKVGEHTDSLLHLWEGTIASTTTIGAKTASIDREALIDEVAEIMRVTAPRVIHTGDIAATHGRDHSDHMLTAALATLALARAGVLAELVSYRGYNTPIEPINKTDVEFELGKSLLGYFMACFTGCDVCGSASCQTISEAHSQWLHHRYAIARRMPPLDGVLATGEGCLATTLAITNCPNAPSWHFERDGSIRSPQGTCIAISTSGDATLAQCDGSAAQFFVLDDEGHVFSGSAPAASPGMDYAHLRCLVGNRAELCGADRESRWTLTRGSIATDLAAIGLTGPLVLGDVIGSNAADLCTATPDGVRCAVGIGDGSFGPSTLLQGAGAPLLVDPASLRIGDVDGDGRADVCGRRNTDVVCAFATQQFESPRLYPGAAQLDDLQLVTLGRERRAFVCGRRSGTTTCLRGGHAFAVDAPATGPLWIADLDGDGVPDWCVADPTGMRCARRTRPPTAWAFSLGGHVEDADGVALDPTRAAFVDLDGDRNLDLCRISAGDVVCANGQGYSLGPSHRVAAAVGDVLVTGDLDGDGRSDVCTRTGTRLACTRSP